MESTVGRFYIGGGEIIDTLVLDHSAGVATASQSAWIGSVIDLLSVWDLVEFKVRADFHLLELTTNSGVVEGNSGERRSPKWFRGGTAFPQIFTLPGRTVKP